MNDRKEERMSVATTTLPTDSVHFIRAYLDQAHGIIAEFKVGRYEQELLASLLLRGLIWQLPDRALLSVAEVGCLLNVKETSVYQLRAQNKLKPTRFGSRKIRFSAAAVREFMEAAEAAGIRR